MQRARARARSRARARASPKANPEREAWIHEERNLSFGEKGERHPNFGEKLSDEQKLKISAANKGEQRWAKAEDTRNDHRILAPPSWFQLAWF